MGLHERGVKGVRGGFSWADLNFFKWENFGQHPYPSSAKDIKRVKVQGDTHAYRNNIFRNFDLGKLLTMNNKRKEENGMRGEKGKWREGRGREREGDGGSKGEAERGREREREDRDTDRQGEVGGEGEMNLF